MSQEFASTNNHYHIKHTDYQYDMVVKYHQIEEELMAKVRNGTLKVEDVEPDEGEKLDDIDLAEDIADLCNRLYQDELVSAFGLEQFDEVEITKRTKKLLAKFNPECQSLVANLGGEEWLFSYPLFHLTHPCICQQENHGTMDETTLLKWKEGVASLSKDIEKD